MVESLVRTLILLWLLAGLLACALKPDPHTSVDYPVVTLAEGSAAASLLSEARLARREGNLIAAGRYLERALGLEPTSPLLYRELADLRLEEGLPDQAEGLALRALRLSPENPHWQADLWAMIAVARHRLGLSERAEQAAEQARILRNHP